MQVLGDVDDTGTWRDLSNIREPKAGSIAKRMNDRLRQIAGIPQQDMQMRVTAPLKFDGAKVRKRVHAEPTPETLAKERPTITEEIP
jgi:hypothetical protein